MRRLTICASLFVLVLTSASALAQEQSKPQTVNAEVRDLPLKFFGRTPLKDVEKIRRVFSEREVSGRERLSSEDEIGGGRLLIDPPPQPAAENGAIRLQSQEGEGPTWPQWGRDSQHASFIPIAGQSFNSLLADITYDPNAPASAADQGGDLLAHYQTALTSGNDVWMEFKTGTFTTLDQWQTQIWNQKRLHWKADQGVFETKWTFQSDWKPVPFASFVTFNGPTWEPVYHSVLVGDFLYDPGFGGTVFKLDKGTGAVLARINPFGSSIDPNIFVAGPLSADSAGNVYYNAIKLSPTDPWDTDVVNSWLVKIAPNGTATKVTYATLTPGSPAATDQCKVSFLSSQLPWPPSPNAQPGTTNCGTQRPGINVAPAIAPDGTIYTVSRAQLVTRYNYLIAVNPDLTPKWNASLRNRLNDGCNVLIPPNGTPGGCRTGATTGVDPSTNEPPPGRVIDESSASPTVLPDGSVVYGAYTRYNFAQGHLMRFSSTGQFLAAYKFGWDITPGVFSHDGTYSIMTKDNRYAVGSYCNSPSLCPSDRTATTPTDPEQFFITRLNPSLTPEWSYKNTNTLSCTRQPNGSVTCVDDHPNSFEWCVNQFAIDVNGVSYVNSEDGNVFAIRADGTLREKRFLNIAIGAAYTPTTIGPDGKIYAQNFGHLLVLGDQSGQHGRNGWGVFRVDAAAGRR